MFLKALDYFFTEFLTRLYPNFCLPWNGLFFKSRDCFFVAFSTSVPPKNKVILTVMVDRLFVQLISFLGLHVDVSDATLISNADCPSMEAGGGRQPG
jgi:hypothetical protein